jgi:hypothetical protein
VVAGMELNGRELGRQASEKITDTLKGSRKASLEKKRYIKTAIEVSKLVNRK